MAESIKGVSVKLSPGSEAETPVKLSSVDDEPGARGSSGGTNGGRVATKTDIDLGRVAADARYTQNTPLAALLPLLGNLKTLHRIEPLLAERLDDLENDKSSSEPSAVQDHVREELMLEEVMKWLRGPSAKK